MLYITFFTYVGFISKMQNFELLVGNHIIEIIGDQRSAASKQS